MQDNKFTLRFFSDNLMQIPVASEGFSIVFLGSFPPKRVHSFVICCIETWLVKSLAFHRFPTMNQAMIISYFSLECSKESWRMLKTKKPTSRCTRLLVGTGLLFFLCFVIAYSWQDSTRHGCVKILLFLPQSHLFFLWL